MCSKDLTDIQIFYHNTTVLLTNGTSTIGKLVLEKLMRCTTVKKVYVIVEYKRNSKDAKQKLFEYLQDQVFHHLRLSRPKLEEKIVILKGDCILPNFGLSEDTRNIICKEVEIVIHGDTTINLDLPLSAALKINLRSIKDVLDILRKMPNLKSMIYLSTAYCNFPSSEMEEIFYESRFKAQDLISMTDLVNDSFINEIQQTVLKECPNTYIFTKKMAENLLNTEGTGLPIGIIRPGMVSAAVEEPFKGYIDNCYGPTGVWLSTALGYIRTIHIKSDVPLELTPVDYLVNLIFATSWVTFKTLKIKGPKDFKIPIFNLLPAQENQISYDTFHHVCIKTFKKQPSLQLVWYPFTILTSSKLLYLILNFILNLVPVYTYDFIANILGRKNCRYMKIYKLYERFNMAFSPFFLKNLEHRTYCTNVKAIFGKMSDKDRIIFNFDMSNINWTDYLDNFVKGLRLYLLKEDEKTIPGALKKLHERKIYNIVVITFVSFIFVYFLMAKLFK